MPTVGTGTAETTTAESEHFDERSEPDPLQRDDPRDLGIARFDHNGTLDLAGLTAHLEQLRAGGAPLPWWRYVAANAGDGAGDPDRNRAHADAYIGNAPTDVDAGTQSGLRQRIQAFIVALETGRGREQFASWYANDDRSPTSDTVEVVASNVARYDARQIATVAAWFTQSAGGYSPIRRIEVWWTQSADGSWQPAKQMPFGA